ncbi:hypothetical protein [uncultured Tenacibaculum sp.]|uniref:hypothetical protein n=1 Tax=uncultured Tenacibaculum sp. TaxID=174713 RepID=UPI00262BCA36|nr:hypothetical protein [uncultured Tenacibaculum sp.]
MNFKFNRGSVQDTATLGVGAIAGTYVSKGISAVVPSEINEPIIKAAIGAGGIVLGGSIQGKGSLANLLRGVCLGLGAENISGAINGLVAPTLPADSTTKTQKIAKAMFGMNSPIEEDYMPTFIPPSLDVWENTDSVNSSNDNLNIAFKAA